MFRWFEDREHIRIHKLATWLFKLQGSKGLKTVAAYSLEITVSTLPGAKIQKEKLPLNGDWRENSVTLLNVTIQMV